MRLRFATILLALGLAIGPVTAQERDCGARDQILALSALVLEHRAELPRLQARRYGAEAAYLTIKYGSLAEAEVAAFLTGLLGQDIRDLRDLAFAWYVTTHGLDAAASALGPEAMRAAVLLSATTIRALILADADEVVLDALAALPAAERYGPLQRVYASIIDQPDIVKARVAAKAEERGLIEVAAPLYASQRDTAAWTAFIGRVADPAEAANHTRMLEYVPIFVGNPPLSGVEHHDPAAWSKIFIVMAGGVVQPQVEYLNTFLNQSGLYEEASAVATALKQHVESGRLPATGPFDAGWLFTYRELHAVVGDGMVVDGALRGLSLGGRHLRPTSADVLDWIIASDALRSYAAGLSSDLPAAPAGPTGTLTETFDEWIEVAELVRSNAPPEAFSGNERRLAMAAELMFAAERYVSLSQLVEAASPSLLGVALAADFAERLDRGCAAYLWHPAEAVVLAGTPIYKFDEPPAGRVPTDQSPGRSKN